MNIVRAESIALFCLTPAAIGLAQRLQAHLPLNCFTCEALLTTGFQPFNGSFTDTLREALNRHSVLIVVGALGVTVRVIASLLDDKLTAPAVVVIDECGQHVINLLSGHVGGANALTQFLAGLLGAAPVITKVTDVSKMTSLDE